MPTIMKIPYLKRRELYSSLRSGLFSDNLPRRGGNCANSHEFGKGPDPHYNEVALTRETRIISFASLNIEDQYWSVIRVPRS